MIDTLIIENEIKGRSSKCKASMIAFQASFKSVVGTNPLAVNEQIVDHG